jgi:uncharacterized SAM-binding protein YcdF (DUF218 family)
MFFLLSKLLLFVLSPIIWIIILLVCSVFSANKRNKRRLLIAAISILIFFSNSFILDEVLRFWEIGYVKHNEIKKEYDYGILLGGMGEYDAQFDRVNFNNGADRLIQTLVLYNEGIIKKIIVTSGSGSILHKSKKEADFIKDYAMRLGVPDTCLIIENESRNTYENALFTKHLTANFNSNSSYLLITSAFHMRRSKACFIKAGFKIDLYAVNKITGKRKFEFDHMFIPEKDAFYYWDILIHEIVGFIVYKIVGYT